MTKDWTGNKNSTFSTLGASNHSDYERSENDYYATSPLAINGLLKHEILNNELWENACVDNDTEFFNGKYWKKIQDYNKFDKVLIFDGENGFLEQPLEYVKEKTGENFYYFSGLRLNMCLTKDHTVIYHHRRNNKLLKTEFKNIEKMYKSDSNGFRGRIPTTFKWFDDLNIDETLLRIAVACNADGKKCSKKSYLIRVKKQRKRDRLLYLLNKTNIKYSYKFYKDYYHFQFVSPFGCKLFPKKWYNLNQKLKKAIIDECIKWDGSITKDNTRFYFSSKKEDIDFIQMIAHSIGIGTNLSIDRRNERKDSYRISFLSKTKFALHKNHKKNLTEIISKDGYKYCFKVSTGMLILRRSNKIFITGNCGAGHLAQKLSDKGYDVFGTDIIDRGYANTRILDFLKDGFGEYADALVDRDIITNPPYKYAEEWTRKSIELLSIGFKLYLFLKITFLEGQKRRLLFDKYPPKYVLVFSKRIQVARNGDPEMFKKSSAACYAWFVWEKGFTGNPIIKWI